MLSSSASFFSDNPLRLLLCTVIVKYKDIAPQLLLVIDQWKDVDVPELRESWVLENVPDGVFSLNDIFILLQAGEHQEVLVCGQLEGAVTIGLETDRKLSVRDLVDDIDVFLVQFGSI